MSISRRGVLKGISLGSLMGALPSFLTTSAAARRAR